MEEAKYIPSSCGLEYIQGEIRNPPNYEQCVASCEARLSNIKMPNQQFDKIIKRTAVLGTNPSITIEYLRSEGVMNESIESQVKNISKDCLANEQYKRCREDYNKYKIKDIVKQLLENPPEGTIEEITNSIIKRGILGMNVIFELKFLNDFQRQELWKGLSTNKNFQSLIRPISLEVENNQELQKILQPFCEQPRISQAIIESHLKIKDLNNNIIKNHQSLTLSPNCRQYLTKLIFSMGCYKKWCQQNGVDGRLLRFDLEKSLLAIMTEKLRVLDNGKKITVIQKIIDQPTVRIDSLAQFLDSEQIALLKNELKNSESFKKYKSFKFQSCPHQQKVNTTVSGIIQDLINILTNERDLQAASTALINFNLPEFYKIRQLLFQKKQVQKLLQDNQTYMELKRYKGKDTEELTQRLKEKIEEKLICQKTPEEWIDSIISPILNSGDLSAFQENEKLSPQVRSKFAPQIENFEEYKQLQSLKWMPRNNRQAAKDQIISTVLLSDVNLGDFKILDQLSEKILNSKSIQVVRESQQFSPADGRNLYKLMSRLPTLTKYLAFQGSDINKDKFEFSKSFRTEVRRLKIDACVGRKLFQNITKDLNTKSVKTEKLLTEVQRMKLIEYFKKNKIYKQYAKTCVVHLGKKVREDLSDKIEEKASVCKGKLSSCQASICEAVMNYYYVQRDLEDLTFDDVSIGQLFKEPGIDELLESIKNSDEHKQYKKHYANFWNSVKIAINDRMTAFLKEVVAEFDYTGSVEGAIKALEGCQSKEDWKEKILNETLLRGIKANQIGNIAKSVFDSQTFKKQFTSVQNIFQRRASLLTESSYEEMIEGLEDHEFVISLSQEALEQILKSLKEFSILGLTSCEELSLSSQKEIAKVVLQSQELSSLYKNSGSKRALIEEFMRSLGDLCKMKPSEIKIPQPVVNVPIPQKEVASPIKAPESPKKVSSSFAPPKLEDEQLMRSKSAALNEKYETLYETGTLFQKINLNPEELPRLNTEFKNRYKAQLEGKIGEQIEDLKRICQADETSIFGKQLRINNSININKVENQLRSGSLEFDIPLMNLGAKIKTQLQTKDQTATIQRMWQEIRRIPA